MPITDDTLARLRALHKAATDGPWVAEGDDLIVQKGGGGFCVACVRTYGSGHYAGRRTAADEACRELIIAMHDALPGLLDLAESDGIP